MKPNILLPALLLLTLPSCDQLGLGARPIAEIRAAAPTLEGKGVRVKGKVESTNQLPFVATRFYKLNDGTGEIWIATAQPLPAVGDTVVVSGELHNAAVIGGASLGMQIRESSRSKAR
jgi:hypothetical protein